MYTYICVCVYIYMCIYIYTYIYICTLSKGICGFFFFFIKIFLVAIYIFFLIYMCVYIYIVCIYMCVYIYIYIYIYIYMHIVQRYLWDIFSSFIGKVIIMTKERPEKRSTFNIVEVLLAISFFSSCLNLLSVEWDDYKAMKTNFLWEFFPWNVGDTTRWCKTKMKLNIWISWKLSWI